MKPLYRQPQQKASSARQFRRNTERTKAANMNARPMRGGYRF